MYANDKYFSFPPFISTSWEHVVSINYKDDELFVSLDNGNIIDIQGLSDEEVFSIFKAHAKYLEKEASRKREIEQTKGPLNFAPQSGQEILKLGFGASDGSGAMLQHNPAQANAPELPKEVLNKIGSIAKILAPEDITILPIAEPHCNCFHCQIARAIEGSLAHHAKEEEVEEIIADEELNFQQWEITQVGDKLYSATNKLDPQESYRVFLGEPVGCTCGKEGCEHILAVLKS